MKREEIVILGHPKSVVKGKKVRREPILFRLEVHAESLLGG